MKAAWYEKRGAATDVLVVGEMTAPEPDSGEVRIQLVASGISPGDTKKRNGWQGEPMPYPRVIPHSDGAGVIDAVGPDVDPTRMGECVWCYGAQSHRAFGTAAEFVVVPERLAVRLPQNASHDLLEQAACLGIAGITGWRAIFADGSVRGLNVLVWGAAFGVGAVALQMAVRDGAKVFAIVRKPDQARITSSLHAAATFLADDQELVDKLKAAAPTGMHRIADVDFGGHIDTDAAVLAIGGVIASYYSHADQPPIPYWALGFADATLRLLGSDDFSPVVKAAAAAELTAALVEGKLRTEIGARFALKDIALAHARVDAGAAGKTIITL